MAYIGIKRAFLCGLLLDQPPGLQYIPNTPGLIGLNHQNMSNLSESIHINELSKKISRANGILAKLKYFATKKILILVYYAIFYSQLLYGSPVWSLTTVNINTIRILQKNVSAL